MKKIVLGLLFTLFPLLSGAHDHIEVRRDPNLLTRLSVISTPSQTATFFPLGEKPSYYLNQFPGGAYTNELSFSAFDNTSPPPGGAMVRVELVSVVGPADGAFSFWEVGAATPTWTREAGWVSTESDKPSFAVSEDNTGYGHIHGRAFTMSRAGEYDVTFRVLDSLGNYTASQPFVIRFTAIKTPQLSIRMENGSIKLSFISRANLVYDVQSSTTLANDDWSTVGDPLDGDGEELEYSEALNGRSRVFFRLVEYQ